MKIKISLLLTTLIFSGLLNAQGKFFGGNGDGFATVTISNVVLPVEIVHFSVSRADAIVKAELTVVSTESICGLQLERRTTGSDYVVVDSLTGMIQGGDFVFTDRRPVPGDNYYRARITRCDGGIVLSKILLLRTTATLHQFVIADGGIQYTITKNGVLEIINSGGQTIYRRTLSPGTGLLAIPVLSSGMYFLRFEGQPAGRFFAR